MIQTWNHNLISKSMTHHPSCSITKISHPPLHLSFLCHLVYSHSSFILHAYLFSNFLLLIRSQTWILDFWLCISISTSSHGVLLLHCVVCCHQHLLFIEHNFTNNNFCSRTVLCKFRFSSATFFLLLVCTQLCN